MNSKTVRARYELACLVMGTIFLVRRVSREKIKLHISLDSLLQSFQGEESNVFHCINALHVCTRASAQLKLTGSPIL